MRALPEQFRAAIATAHADVRVEVEDRMAGQLAVPIDQARLVMKLTERAPDGLMDAQRVRVLHQRCELQVERLARAPAGRQVARQCQTGTPVLRILVDQPAAQAREPFRRPRPDRERFEAI